MNIKEKLKNMNKNSLFIVFSAIGFILLVLLPVWCEGVKEELVVSHLPGFHKQWLYNDEIVYAKEIKWKTKGAVGGWPRKKRMQICRMNVDTPDSEQVLVDIEYKTVDRREGRFHIYKNKSFQGITRINGIGVSRSHKKIAVAVNPSKPYARSPEPAGGLFTMDYDGLNIEFIVKERVRGLQISPDGRYLLYWARLPVEMRKIYGNMAYGKLLYNFETKKIRYFLGVRGKSWWAEDSKSVIVARDEEVDGKNQTKYYRYNLEGKLIEELPKDVYLEIKHVFSPDNKYCYFRKELYADHPGHKDEIKFPAKVDAYTWSPDSKRFVSGHYVIDVEKRSMRKILFKDI